MEGVVYRLYRAYGVYRVLGSGFLFVGLRGFIGLIGFIGFRI